MDKKENKKHGNFFLKLGIYTSRYKDYLELLEHYHPEMEMVLIEEGEASVRIDKKIYSLKKGDIVIIEPNKLHDYQTSDCSIRSTNIVFDLSLITNELYEYSQQAFIMPLASGKLLVNHVLHPLDIGYDDIIEIIRKLIVSYHKMEYGYQLEVKSYLLLILFKIISQKGINKVTIFNKEEELSTQIVKMINSDYLTNLSVSSIAKKMAYSESYIMRVFKKQTHQTINSYVKQLRLEKSCSLLNESNMSVSEISSDIFFSDVSYFIESFNKAYGITPYQYRKKVRGDLDVNKRMD